MRKSQLTAFLLLLFIESYTFSQTQASSQEYDWRLSVSSGITKHLDKKLNIDITSMSYLEYSIGYFINPSHEIGIKIGRNDFLGGILGITSISWSGNDTTITYGIINGLYPEIWHGLYYRFNYMSWNLSLLAGAMSGFDHEYTAISIGREFKLSNIFFIEASLNYALKTNKYKWIYGKQLIISARISCML